MTKRATRATDLPRAASRQRSRPAARRPSWKRRLKTFVALTILLVETVIAAALACSLIVFQRFSHTLPNVEELSTDIRPPVATTIWSQDGVLLGQLDVENRQPITLDDMPPNLVNATIAIEDHRFYEHKGVDLQGIARAAFANFAAGHARGQGGSTLTQQLVRNVGVFGVTKEKSYSRKIREALIAVRMEQVYSKREILALYLNNIYYGGGAYGVQAAAKTYFGKSAYKLDLSEAALLAGLPQRPSAFSPFEHRSAALKRRDEVIDSMLRYKQITADQADEAKTEELHFMPQQRHKDFNFKAPHFVWYVLNDLFRRYGPSFVYSGLHIDTTLNWKMQQEAEAQLEHGLQKSEGNQGALVSLDNANGYIRALVGGRNFRASQYNNVTQGRRQCGSTFKLFDYTAAFNEGKCDIYSTFEDRPIPYPNDHRKVVKNFGGTYHYAPMSCLTAIQWSVNTIAVQAAQTVGIGKVIEYAHKMGITTELSPYLPTALGASAVRPLDLCSAYSLMADKGVRFHPMSLIRVIDADGNVLEENAPVSEPSFLKPHTVEQMEQGLEAVVMGGSGTRARGDQTTGIVEGAHGKTGTTSDSRDAWFAGYTPELTTVIWVASVHRNKHGIINYEPMGNSTGGAVCAPIWHDFMIKAVLEERKYRQALQQLESRPALPQTAEVETPKKPKTNEHPIKTDPQPQSLAPAAGGTSPLWNHLPDSATKPDTGAKPADGANPAPATGTGQTDVGANTVPGTLAPAALTTSPTPTIAPPVTAPPTENAGPRATTPHIDAVAGGQAVAPPHPVAPRTAAPPATAAPEIVEVTLCVDSGKRATPWCPATNTVRMTRQQAAHVGRCRMHTPPPGEH